MTSIENAQVPESRKNVPDKEEKKEKKKGRKKEGREGKGEDFKGEIH